MKLQKVTPLERAIGAIDDAIKTLKAERVELATHLPRRKPARPLGFIVDYRTGEKHRYGRAGKTCTKKTAKK